MKSARGTALLSSRLCAKRSATGRSDALYRDPRRCQSGASGRCRHYAKGRRVTDLQASDFELLQDSKAQAIANFSYVATKPASGAQRSPAPKLAKGDVPPPAPVLQPTEVHRALAFIVDGLGLAGENVPPVRDAIRKFLDNDMRADDLVAIVRTGAGMGALQQFTTDKRLLYEALDRVKYGESRVGMSSFTPLGSTRGGRGGRESLDHFREQTCEFRNQGLDHREFLAAVCSTE